MEDLIDIETKVDDLTVQASIFADLCDVIEFADFYAKGNKNYESKISSAIVFIVQEAQRIAEMCGDLQSDMRNYVT